MNKKVLSSLTAVIISVSLGTAPFISYSTRAVYGGETVRKPAYKHRAQIPEPYKWQLTHIYANQVAWEVDVKKVEQLSSAFASYQGALGKSASQLKQALDDYSQLMRLHDKVYVYAQMSFDVHMSNPERQAMLDKADKVSTRVKEQTSFVAPELTAIPTGKLKTLLGSDTLGPYRTFVADMVRTKAHTLSKEMEQLLAAFGALTDAPESTAKMLLKDMKFPTIKDETGKEVQLTQANYVTFMQSKNRDVRKQAFQAIYQTIGKFQDTFAQTLASHVQANNLYAKARKYDSARAASLTPNNVPVTVYDELITTVNKHLPLLHRYMQLKKQVLGVQALHMYDLHVPIAPSDDRYIPIEEAKQIVWEGLQPLGGEYQDLLKESYSGGWIDVYTTEDKRSGAYQWGSYDTHPYVLLNYQGTYNDVFTLAHELGHAMQSSYTNKRQPYISSHYPIFTAEVASTMNEILLFKSMYRNAKTKAEKMFLLNQHLENFRTTLFRQTQFATFERVVHEKEQQGESLNAAALKKLYLAINQAYYGKEMVSDAEVALEWARVPHFYYNFYVYQYATSFAASVALAKQVIAEGKPAVERIRDNFLAAGNSAAPLDMLKAAGVDMSTPEPIEQAMKEFKETLDEFERLLQEK